MPTLGIDVGGSSVKIAVLEGERVVATAHSVRYRRPGREELLAAMRGVLEPQRGLLGGVDAVGVCVPGVVDTRTNTVTASVNQPGLVDVPLGDLIGQALGGPAPARLRVVSDALAAAHDYRTGHLDKTGGRLLAISMGTGVGMAVLDDGRPLLVSGSSSGHIGQMDVTVSENGREPPVGPDGGTGSLEAYVGLPALMARYGPDVAATLRTMTINEPPLRALVKAIRIAHAIYRPNHVVLLGGVGLALVGTAPALHQRICQGLTSLARAGWTLRTGDTDLHAAIGAARLAQAGA